MRGRDGQTDEQQGDLEVSTRSTVSRGERIRSPSFRAPSGCSGMRTWLLGFAECWHCQCRGTSRRAHLDDTFAGEAQEAHVLAQSRDGVGPELLPAPPRLYRHLGDRLGHSRHPLCSICPADSSPVHGLRRGKGRSARGDSDASRGMEGREGRRDEERKGKKEGVERVERVERWRAQREGSQEPGGVSMGW